VSEADRLKAWRERAFRDPDVYEAFDWSDPVERVALVSWAQEWNTPDRVLLELERAEGRTELTATWMKKLPADRQLLRRRADVAIRSMLSAPAGAV
jgi:hypothetical protein